MEASVRILSSTNRHLSNSLLLKYPPLKSSPVFPRHISFPHTHRSNTSQSSLFFSARNHPPSPHFSLRFTCPVPTSSTHHFARIASGSERVPFRWSTAWDGVSDTELGIVKEKGPVVTVVLLGWLGSKERHLRRYVELYNSRGIHAVTFTASVMDVLSFDLGRRLQERISALSRELASWLSEAENDGRERQDLPNKIKGCVVDSGGDPELNPKVWAAGFTTALLKKHGSGAFSSVDAGEGNALEVGVELSSVGEKKPLSIEVFLLLAFEKLFSFLLNLPDINQRLMKIISVLSQKQPPCPQLYLYSRADKVIPFQSVESFAEEQKKLGRKVWSLNFGSSPHVDHYRTFPDLYSKQLHNFLRECLATVKQT
ncbi:hypothetical protein RJ639_012992 [Escallonia herrerae]|uniref:Transmembrane protein 53 n=1 Tax=Escallonia herrerae TaxID=1293975 RepID=A0AA88VRB8_9ASTE|nr:hypothetical protein RJ639_012992 [Escallonia herrerae]